MLATRPLWQTDASPARPPPLAPSAAPAKNGAPDADPAAAWRLLRRFEQFNEAAALQASMVQAGAVLRHDAGSLSGWMALGRARDALADFDRARALFARAERVAPASSATARATADTWLATGDLDTAWRTLVRAAARAPDDLENTRRLLLLAHTLEDFGAADRWAERLENRVTRQAGALAELARHRYLSGNFDQAVQLSNIALRLNLLDRWDADAVFMRIKRDEAIGSGRFSGAIALLRERHAELFADPPRIVPGNIQQAVDLASLLQGAGASERADTLLRSAVAAYGQPGFTLGSARTVILSARAEALALLGEERAALTELERIVDAGWRVQWRWETELNLNFVALRDAPGFRRLVERIEADVGVHRERLRAAGLPGA
ncbi:MAG: hypothetical protein P8106_09125 [Gammaproteobacteria bacterium]